jgi:DNA-binding MurR/RpiR family transcriptional regulator
VESARVAHRVGASLIAITDSVTAPMAEGAAHLLLYEAASSPGFFPSLTGAIAIAQSLAAVTFVLGGTAAKKRLEGTEARLAATSQYVSEKG